MRQSRSAQSMIEIAIVLAAIVAGILTMMVYVKSSLAGRSKQSADSLGEGFDPINGSSQSQNVQFGESSYEIAYVNGSEVGLHDWRKDRIYPTSVQQSGGNEGMQSTSVSSSAVSYEGVK